MTGPDLDYYARREQQERETALRCDDHGVRRLHLELAERYSAILRGRVEMPLQQL